MPTADDPPRPTRRALGRGPGIRPATAPADPVDSPGGPAPAARALPVVPAVPAAPVVPAEPAAASAPPEAPGAPYGEEAAAHAPQALQGPLEPAERPSTAGRETLTAVRSPASAETGPAETAPAETGPAESVPAKVGPAESVPAKVGPAETGPAGTASEGDDRRFTVRLVNFEGPFDLLLQLISKHKLDVTEVALSKVTDEFMAHIRAMGPDWDLDQTTEFLVVAATLLDLKAARLLPTAEVEDEADLALLEARDLLFARLLQYRAYKRIAEIFSDRLEAESRRHPRTVGLEPQHAELLPEVVISIGPEGFARLAVKAMQPRPKPQVYVDHIHAPLVSVREQAEIVVARLRAEGEISFADLTGDAADTLTVVARFLALLELYREKAVALDQEEALGDLMVRWAGGEGAEPVVTDEFDQEVPEPQEDVQA
ncbi:segregation/condensation protein A [Streptomyces sp. NPDC001741]|uniref:segregation and condensation protein A n=1 Tax=Streptomyces sp. NPDC001741 TaxID=3364605 RepID=UPI0036A6C9C0